MCATEGASAKWHGVLLLMSMSHQLIYIELQMGRGCCPHRGLQMLTKSKLLTLSCMKCTGLTVRLVGSLLCLLT
jgi:hypothetical protein